LSTGPIKNAKDVDKLLAPPALPPKNDHAQLHPPASADATRVALARVAADLSVTQNNELEQTIIVQCMLQVLIQKGFIRPAELDAVYGQIREHLVAIRQQQLQGPIVIPDDIVIDAALDLDCKAHYAACGAACCTSFHVFLTPEEARSGRYVWDLRAPYKLLTDDHGTCVYFDHDTLGCSIWSERPKACRSFDCRKEPRVWQDYPARIVRTEILEARARRAAERRSP